MKVQGLLLNQFSSSLHYAGWLFWLSLSLPLTLWGEYPLSLVNVPREGFPVLPIFFSPLFHVNFTHLFSNLEVLLPTLFLLYFLDNTNFSKILFQNLIASGFILWLFGGHAIHIGLSGLVISLCFYSAITLFAKPSIKRVSAGILFILAEIAIFLNFYQEQPGISSDAHICGGISGLILGLVSLFKTSPNKA